MKSQSKYLLVLLLSLTTAVGYSQVQPKPKIFASQAESFEFPSTLLSDAFNYAAGQQVTLAFTSNFSFTGVVLSNEQKYSNLQTVIIRSANYDNALLQISKVFNADRSFYYSGRIINERSADGLEIRQEANGYIFKKFETEKVLQDCSYN